MAVASRTLYALARDGLLADEISATSRRTGTTIGAVTASMALTLVALLAFGHGGTSALDAFFYLATIGTLSILVVYVIVSVSAARLEKRTGARLRLIPPLGAALVAVYVLYRNLIPAPAFPYDLFPYVLAGWLSLGVSLAAAVPEVRRRVGEGLALR